mmetsp:Transcript_67271/g.194549  ORF Transcript_67271/g.194549 Transcript_67271/m.194549 type:complete len:622 (-) Transcript_67271:341-2206(-)|eukprot:CAMPEP_0176003240 /NCGR_PEP_ID=MMETSP0120_2-20121206/1072_1 /TAXON_ID=160619 /ORGANISM="Kryptoperidinium foliaceum, Strain CCMP 1326" /LENGTH=621 /DNA_ID=CAMNT_0017335877 /DNA_START=240 /DNA_END=2105 /DNA_ORIENTATION=-
MENQADHESIGAGPLNVPRSEFLSPRFHKDRQCFKWSRVLLSPDSIVPPPRSGAASVVVAGKLYMFGGYGGGTGRLDDFYSFDFRTQSWEEVKVIGNERPGCRENNGVVISDDSSNIFLFGGYNGTSWLNDLWKFDIEKNKWTCIQESSDVTVAGEMNALDHESESLQAAASRVRGRKPSQRFGYVSVIHNNKLVLFGGFDGSRWLNDMFVFDFETKAWSEVHARGMLPSVRSCPAWAKDNTHVYIQGGHDGVERKDDFFACDLTTYTWTQMPNFGTVPSPRYFHSCCLYGSKMYLYGGYSGSQRLADMHAYDFETNAWSQIDANVGEVPSGRSSLVAQVYQNNLYVFGGYNGSRVLNDFYKFRLKPIDVPPSGLVGDFTRLLNDPELSDVCFLVERKEVYAHRAILAIRSEYFKVLLFGHMRESVNSINGALAPIEVGDVSHKVFMKVLEYLYTDTIKDVNLELGVHLLIASEQFMLDRLKQLCEDIIRTQIDASNVTSILVTSHQHNAGGLKEIAMEFILNNLTEKEIQRGLSDLKSEPDLLVEIIKLSSSVQHSPSNSQAQGAGIGPERGQPQQPYAEQVPNRMQGQDHWPNMMEQNFQQNGFGLNGPFVDAWGSPRR